MKKLATVLLTAMGMSVVPTVIPPAANADVCAAGGERFYVVGGCTNVAGHAVAIVAELSPYYLGEMPCYTAEGVPYYTPADYPC
jgi:hypothetical protein